VNPTLDRQLARLRTRLAKTPLPGFFAWWGRELLACLPVRWRAVLSERSESLVLALRDEELVVWREKGEHMREYARIRRDLPAEAQQAEFRRLRDAIEDPQVRTVFCIPAERVLTRVMSLPVAATENLRQVLSFEMDRQTPFKADQVYFDSRVLGQDASGRNAQIELVLIPRGQLDQELATLPAAAADLDGVDSWNGVPGEGRRQINLLPPEKRARRRNMRLPLNLGLAAFALLLLLVVMDESLTNRAAALESMQAEVDKANNDAKQVAALRKTLSDSISGANFLTDKKRKGPLMVALLDDLTRRLPLDTYLERLQIENKQVQLQGQANEAAKLIALLGTSPCLGNPGFQGQVQPDARTGKERFQINADLKECSPKVDAKPQAETKPAAVADAKKPPAAPTKPDAGAHKPEPAKPESAKPEAAVAKTPAAEPKKNTAPAPAAESKSGAAPAPATAAPGKADPSSRARRTPEDVRARQSTQQKEAEGQRGSK
jgi:general secretion pathway protein L